jgi:hypothetical protein
MNFVCLLIDFCILSVRIATEAFPEARIFVNSSIKILKLPGLNMERQSMIKDREDASEFVFLACAQTLGTGEKETVASIALSFVRPS